MVSTVLWALHRQRRSIVSVDEYEVDKAALERMLKDFEDDYLRSHTVLSPTGRCRMSWPETDHRPCKGQGVS